MILAAGASRRMGQPKALLPWAGSTLLDYAIHEARSAHVDALVVVLGPATAHLRLDVTTAFNPDPETGRSASIRIGTAALPDDIQAVLVQSVDQPSPAEVLNALYDALGDSADIAIPTYGGRRGHPVCFAASLLAELRAVTEAEQGLRAIVRRHAGRLVEVAVAAESAIWNLNDPQAYAAARAKQ